LGNVNDQANSYGEEAINNKGEKTPMGDNPFERMDRIFRRMESSRPAVNRRAASGCRGSGSVRKRRFPEGNNQSTRYDKRTTNQGGQTWRCAESGKIDDLPDDKQRGNVEACHASKFHWRPIKAISISEQQAGASKKKSEACDSRVPVDPNSDNGITAYLHCGGEQ
jgi:hypothetical protein